MLTKKDKLQLISEKIALCTKCEELTQDRIKTVPGYGNPVAKIVCLGEGPGRDESIQGKPFVGRAGSLLNDVLKTVGLNREKDIWITNIVKCRPPKNRNPDPQEITNCRPYLDLQLKIINPKYIVCMGAVATHNLLDINTPISKIRGMWQQYGKIKVLPIFHPAYALRNPNARFGMIEDFKLLLKEIRNGTENLG